jgi:hypothetical protein
MGLTAVNTRGEPPGCDPGVDRCERPARRATMPVDERHKEPDMSTHRHAQGDRDGAADTVHPPIDIKLAVVVPAGT